MNTKIAILAPIKRDSIAQIVKKFLVRMGYEVVLFIEDYEDNDKDFDAILKDIASGNFDIIIYKNYKMNNLPDHEFFKELENRSTYGNIIVAGIFMFSISDYHLDIFLETLPKTRIIEYTPTGQNILNEISKLISCHKTV